MPNTKQKAEFYMRQITNALSPTNFVLTNPELLRETFASNADNLVRGMHMLAEDIQTGGGHLKIRQSDASLFEVGRNLAITPGKVIFQNELMQLIQYAPSTETVLKRPLLIVPPWINKYYVLDLTPEKSFIKWCVDQGLTVFCISSVNPDAHLAQKSFDDYVRQGPLAALDAIKEAIGEDKVHAIGYCVGGTLLAVTLAAMAAWHDDRIVSATLFASQVDFTYAGDLKVFVDEEQVAALEQRMAERGYLEGKWVVRDSSAMRDEPADHVRLVARADPQRLSVAAGQTETVHREFVRNDVRWKPQHGERKVVAIRSRHPLIRRNMNHMGPLRVVQADPVAALVDHVHDWSRHSGCGPRL